MTEAERRLWFELRDRRLHGWKFRRQVPIGPWIVDFVCKEARLVAEVDGGQHAESPADAARDAGLRGEGYEVVRFWNNEVLGNLEGVLQQLLGELEKRKSADTDPHPSPLPQAGEGRASR